MAVLQFYEKSTKINENTIKYSNLDFFLFLFFNRKLSDVNNNFIVRREYFASGKLIKNELFAFWSNHCI